MYNLLLFTPFFSVPPYVLCTSNTPSANHQHVNYCTGQTEKSLSLNPNTGLNKYKYDGEDS